MFSLDTIPEQAQGYYTQAKQIKAAKIIFLAVILLAVAALSSIIATSDVLVPTLISYQGKLANQTNGDPLTPASIRINITLRGNLSNVIWNATFDNVADAQGVFSIVLGKNPQLNLTPGKDYNLVAMIDFATTYSSPDIVFGDNSPSGDEIIINGGGPSDATELVMADNTTSVQTYLENLQVGGGTITYINVTPNSYSGNITNGTDIGYKAANKICQAHFNATHFCSSDDINSFIAYNDISVFSGVSSAWIVNGPPGYLANANDCIGWSDKSISGVYGAFWQFDSNGGCRGWLTGCSNFKPLACCK
jgi:hypothetical protein